MLQKMPLSFKLEFSLVYTPHSFASQSRGRVRTGTGTDRTVPFEWSVPCFERFTSRVFLWKEPLHVVQLSLSSEVDRIHFRRSALKPRPLQRDFFFPLEEHFILLMDTHRYENTARWLLGKSYQLLKESAFWELHCLRIQGNTTSYWETGAVLRKT